MVVVEVVVVVLVDHPPLSQVGFGFSVVVNLSWSGTVTL